MGERARPQQFPKLPVTLEMPFAAHGCASRVVSFGVEKNPLPPPRRFRASASIMLLEPPVEIGCPPDIGSVIASAFASQDVNVTVHDSSRLAGTRLPGRPFYSALAPSPQQVCQWESPLWSRKRPSFAAGGTSGWCQADIQHEGHPSTRTIAYLGQNVEGVSRWLRGSWQGQDRR